MSNYAAKKPSFLEDYVTVNTRVSQFYAKFPEGRITTNYQVIDDLIIFQAQVFRNPDDAMPSATGTAMDKINVNDSSTEKTETASVGRALAFLNFETKKGMASREEMEKHNKNSEAGKVINYSNTPKEADARAGTQQVARIRELRKSLNITSSLDFNALTTASADELIAKLEARG